MIRRSATLAAAALAVTLLPFRPHSVAVDPSDALEISVLRAAGFTGSGVTIAIVDGAFDLTLPGLAGVQVLDTRDFLDDDTDVSPAPDDSLESARSGTAVLSILAAQLPDYEGIAPGASFLLARVDEPRFALRADEERYAEAVQWALEQGADIIVSSLGFRNFDDGLSYAIDDLNGDLASSSIAADAAAQAGVIVIAGVGDDGPGPQTLVAPADGDSVIAVGASDSLGFPVDFSSRGGTPDGRIKPDLLAPGVAIRALDTRTGALGEFSGSGYAAAIVAGASALIREAVPGISPTRLLGALRRAGSQTSFPNDTVGWGTPNAAAAATFPDPIRLLTPGQVQLGSVTPEFSWSLATPAFANPITYRLRLVQAGGTGDLLDTILTEQSARLLRALQPALRFNIRITATSSLGTTTNATIPQVFEVPEWVVLTRLNEPIGSTIRDSRPNFRWASPDISSPPGPFTYTLRVTRAEEGTDDLVVTDIDSTNYTPPTDLERSVPYRWSIEAFAGELGSLTESRGTFVIVNDDIPATTLLFQNFPNPFPNMFAGRQTTCIWFDLANPGRVQLDILDLRGHIIRNMIPGTDFPTELPAGRYGRPLSSDPTRCDPSLEWDGTDADGAEVERGVYVMRLVTPDGTSFRRIVYVGRQ